MACYIFTKAILEDQHIKVFNGGDMKRDFTYIDDIVEGIVRVLDQPPLDNERNTKSDPRPSFQTTPHRIYNIGNGSPVKLMDFIEAIEGALGKKAIKDMMPMQPGDLQATWADTTDLFNDFGYRPSTEFRHGVNKFIEWYRSYHKIRIQNE